MLRLCGCEGAQACRLRRSAVNEIQSRSVDSELIRQALAEYRVLLTEDKDFGWLVFAAQMDSPGVILMRFPASARRQMADAVLKLVREHEPELAGAFVVLRPGEARISRGPAGKG
jgi:predicted nuclease of predicted toxin-antitoxin system